MKIILLLAVAALLTGCGPYKVTVYGHSGAAYIAPDLCAAELACQKANETSCYYSGGTQTETDPQTGVKTTTVYGCRKVTPGKK